MVSQPRYRDLIADLQFVARQEIIFGIHVHVGIDDPDKAVHVANGMRVHVPLLLALSANSPFWRGQPTGLESTRTPIFRAFPRVGIPPRYEDFEDWSQRIGFMVDSKVIRDYTYQWYDVRPHPNFGTVEIRAMDSQTRVEHTLGDRGADPGDGQGAGRALRGGQVAVALPVRDARREQVARGPPRPRGRARGPARRDRVPAAELAKRLMERLHPHAEELGSADDFDALEDILEQRHRLRAPAQGLRRQPRPAGGRPRDRARRACPRPPSNPASDPPAGYPERTCRSRTCSSSAATAGRRSART